MAPDYSRQLDAIARALSAPSTPQWVIVVSSMLVGLISGVLLDRIKDWFDRHGMRRMLYRDLAELFCRVDSVMSFKQLSGSQLYTWQEAQLRELISFEGETYLKQKPQLYMQLPERFAADMFYRHLHRVLDEKNSLHVNSYLALAAFAGAVHERSLDPDWLRRFLDNEEAASRIIRRAREINDEQTAIAQRMTAPTAPRSGGGS
jgi:hypothetical protein